ncbi:hypothetical protein [Candidatus Chloroploca asiatica]|uniref:DUF1269 domain-containing family protein n=1 Tax=Candidatus Chloroploca asiatica TaxID=1506545 RepID=A0A2H3L1K3_9CHLR|nr:hypothetical protein [Candidatus Chloroploca asiatica]PDV98529.1 hypothetical protein A9Q02_15180 [Candidatus Chloroploca asiatica]
MKIGPIQVLAFEFESIEKFKGQIQEELDHLRGHGLIRIIDLLFILKEHDGSTHSLQMSDMLAHEEAEFGALLGHMLGLALSEEEEALAGELLADIVGEAPGQGMGIAEIREAAATIPPGKAAAWLMVEHTWAMGLSAAIKGADGYLVAQGFLTRDALLAVGREMHAIVEAEVSIERAEALRGAAMLDALSTVAAAEELEQAAINQATATMVGVEAFRTAIAAEAVRALVVAGLLEESDAPEAIETLVAAELITEAALDEALEAADTAATELAAEW